MTSFSKSYMFCEAGQRANADPLLTIAKLRGSTMAMPTQARVREYFNYDPDAGALTFKERPRSDFGRNTDYCLHLKRIGKVAGSINDEGYAKVSLGSKYYLAHKIIWLFMTGEIVVYPEFEIDHINGVRSDNRWTNLRKVTKSENQRNGSRRVNNTSGVHGVNWKRESDAAGAWVARIWNGPKHVHLGTFKSLHEATIARRAAERALGFTGTERAPSYHACKKFEAQKNEGRA